MRLSVRRLLCIALALLSILGTAGAEGTTAVLPIDQAVLEAMDIDQLLSLREAVDTQLQAKGYVAYYDLERNDQGEAVYNLQQRLAELGFYLGNNSGKYDAETQRAVKLFEKANSLPNDGAASREDQQVLFGQNALTKDNRPVGVPVPTPTPSDPPQDQPDFGLEVETSWSANAGLNGVVLYTPYLKTTVKNQRGKVASRIVINVVFYNESDKMVWDDETYYLVSSGDSALPDGYSKTAFIKSSVGYKSRIPTILFPDITAEISINGVPYDTVTIQKIYD